MCFVSVMSFVWGERIKKCLGWREQLCVKKVCVAAAVNSTVCLVVD